MTELLYFLPPLLAFCFLWFGAEYESYTIGLMSGFLFFGFGLAIIISPLPSITGFHNDILSTFLWGLGLFVILAAATEITEMDNAITG